MLTRSLPHTHTRTQAHLRVHRHKHAHATKLTGCISTVPSMPFFPIISDDSELPLTTETKLFLRRFGWSHKLWLSTEIHKDPYRCCFTDKSMNASHSPKTPNYAILPEHLRRVHQINPLSLCRVKRYLELYRPNWITGERPQECVTVRFKTVQELDLTQVSLLTPTYLYLFCIALLPCKLHSIWS